jgi:Zn ribbon nucleic-acid-binding protein
MAKLKARRVHKAICPTCNGNGYLKIMHEDVEPHVHQCWDCDSEGEFYIYEPKMVSDDDVIDVTRNTDKFLH